MLLGKSPLLSYPIPISDRITALYAEYGVLEMDGHAVVLRQGDSKTHFPVGATSLICIEPGTVVTHAAVKACAQSGCLLVWVGEGGVRCYSSGQPGGAHATKLLHQARLHLNSECRIAVARKIFRLMFDCEPPSGRSIDQLRGIEGSKVHGIYRDLALTYGIPWQGRDQKSALSDALNRTISFANAALYGVVEAAILALGYSPAIGFMHSGDPRSFVFDAADTVKFSTVVPMAFQMHAESKNIGDSAIRIACRDVFRKEKMLEKLVGVVEFLMEEP